MNLQLSRAALVAILLIAVSMTSLTYGTLEAVNYSSYWDARSKLSSTADRLHVETDSASGNVTIQMTVSATNPTVYSGMIVRYFEVRLYFVKLASNQSLFSGDTSGDLIDLVTQDHPPVGDTLGPNAKVTTVLTLQLSSSRSAAFNAFYSPNPNQVYGQVNVRAVVDSFLDTVVGPEVVQSYKTIVVT